VKPYFIHAANLAVTLACCSNPAPAECTDTVGQGKFEEEDFTQFGVGER